MIHWIVVNEAVTTVHLFYGPFDSKSKAEEYSDYLAIPSSVVMVIPPQFETTGQEG